MLPPERRVRSSAEFTQIVRRGVRAGRPLVAVHLLLAVGQNGSLPPSSAAGLVVGKSVGCAVVRHRTSRRLRHLLLAPLDSLPAGTRVVVRAQPGAGVATSADLRLDLTAALAAALAKAARRTRPPVPPAAEVRPAPCAAAPHQLPASDPAGLDGPRVGPR